MSSKGNILFGEEGIPGWALAILIGIIVFGGLIAFTSGPSGIINKIKVITPGWNFGNDTIREDVILRYDLAKRTVEYNNGGDWKVIEGEKDVEVEGLSLNGIYLKEQFEDFYYDTPRIKNGTFVLSADFEKFYYGRSSGFEQFYVVMALRGDEKWANQYDFSEGPVFISKVYEAKGGSDEYLGNLFFSMIEQDKVEFMTSSGYRPLTRELDSYRSFKRDVFVWANQILKGGECEKFIQFSEIGGIEGNNYYVENFGGLLVVRLDSPISGDEKYSLCSRDAFSGNNLEGLEINLERAIQIGRVLEGSYSDNKAFVDKLYENYIISQEEYEEITGKGIFNLKKKMSFVIGLLEEKQRNVNNLRYMSYKSVISSEENNALVTPYNIFLGANNKYFLIVITKVAGRDDLVISKRYNDKEGGYIIGKVKGDIISIDPSEIPHSVSDPEYSLIVYLDGESFEDLKNGKVVYK